MRKHLAPSRRSFLKCCAAGGLGLYPALSLAARLNDGQVLAPRRTHHEPKARQIPSVITTGIAKPKTPSSKSVPP